jgi:hypothetical protein
MSFARALLLVVLALSGLALGCLLLRFVLPSCSLCAGAGKVAWLSFGVRECHECWGFGMDLHFGWRFQGLLGTGAARLFSFQAMLAIVAVATALIRHRFSPKGPRRPF